MSWIQSSFGGKASPIILFIILLLAIVFFFAAFLHLLIRVLVKHRTSVQSHNFQEISGAFQRQLQHLFHLHDSGLDQVYIDALPVFMYKDIVGSNEPFDCAVCLCEFSEMDELRLLPVCSHAFHIGCIDTWLLSNSTCPLCRGHILSPEFSFENPVFHFQDDNENEDGSFRSTGGSFRVPPEGNGSVINEKRVFSVRLGKFRSSSSNQIRESEGGESSNCDSYARRCYSMGSFQYVVANLALQVALCPSKRLKHQEQGGGASDSRSLTREGSNLDREGKKMSIGAKGESFSVSKIWLWSKKGSRVPPSDPRFVMNMP